MTPWIYPEIVGEYLDSFPFEKSEKGVCERESGAGKQMLGNSLSRVVACFALRPLF